MTEMTEPTAWQFDRSDRLRLQCTGADRLKSWHNLTTQNVTGMREGQGTEAFLTSLKGKTLAYLSLHHAGDILIVRADPIDEQDSAYQEVYDKHVGKYLIFDETEVEPITAATFELHLFGPGLSGEIPDLDAILSQPILSVQMLETGGESSPTWLIHERPTGWPGVTVIGPVNALETWHDRCRNLPICEPGRFDRFRIEAGTPQYGREITAENLPQELDRDRSTISFVKGCYIGQETVARLDALGHVNKILRGFRVTQMDPTASQEPVGLAVDGKTVGRLTSIGQTSEPDQDQAAVALGIVRASHAEPGTMLTLVHDDGTELGSAQVCALPLVSR